MEDQVINHTETQSEDKRYNIQLEKAGKKYIFSVPDGTPLGSAYDSCAEILYALSGMIQEATKQMMPKKPEDEAQVASVVSEEVKAEVVNQAN
jgi:hypothetical protein